MKQYFKPPKQTYSLPKLPTFKPIKVSRENTLNERTDPVQRQATQPTLTPDEQKLNNLAENVNKYANQLKPYNINDLKKQKDKYFLFNGSYEVPHDAQGIEQWHDLNNKIDAYNNIKKQYDKAYKAYATEDARQHPYGPGSLQGTEPSQSDWDLANNLNSKIVKGEPLLLSEKQWIKQFIDKTKHKDFNTDDKYSNKEKVNIKSNLAVENSALASTLINFSKNGILTGSGPMLAKINIGEKAKIAKTYHPKASFIGETAEDLVSYAVGSGVVGAGLKLAKGTETASKLATKFPTAAKIASNPTVDRMLVSQIASTTPSTIKIINDGIKNKDSAGTMAKKIVKDQVFNLAFSGAAEGLGKGATLLKKLPTSNSGSFKNIGRKVYRNTVSSDAWTKDVSNVQKNLGFEKSVDESVNLARNSSGTVNQAVNKNLVDKSGNFVSKSLKDIINTAPENVQKNIDTYMMHKANSADGNIIKEITADQSKEIVKNLETKIPGLKKYAEKIYKYQNNSMKNWAANGFINDSVFNEARSRNPYIYPLIKKANGQYEKPIDAIIKRQDKLIKNSRLNDVHNDLIDLAEKYPKEAADYVKLAPLSAESAELEKSIDSGRKIGNLIDTFDNIGVKKIKKGVYQVIGVKDGKIRSAFVNEDIYHGLNSLAGKDISGPVKKFMQVGKAVTSPIRFAAKYNPLSLGYKFIKSNARAYVASGISNPVKYSGKTAEALKDIMSNSENYRIFKALGGGAEPVYNIKKGAKGILERDNIFYKIKKKANGLKNEPTNLTQYREYLINLEKYGNTAVGRSKALLAASDVVANPSRSGKVVKILDSWIPSLNSNVQEMDKFIRLIKAHPLKTTLKAAGAITLPTVVLYGLNKDNPNYKTLDNHTKDSYYNFPNYTDLDENGNPKSFIKIPKTPIYGTIFSSLFERMAQMADGDPNAFKDFYGSAKSDILPGGKILPAAGILLNNKDSSGQPVVPNNMRKLAPAKQYDSDTSALSKTVGRLINFSPKKIDALAKSYSGDIGETLLPLTSDNVKSTEDVRKILLKKLKGKYIAEPRR